MRLALVLLLLATACGPKLWTKPGFSFEEWNRDRYECERDVRQSGYYGGGLIGAINAQGFYDRCLSGHGYTQVMQ
jgi:hypothetical protein